ncbi:Aste57867_25009 [Aphanomyces stellatus]|uniref:Aste57867_25009 protein n=1 Tax=Aphanomyces stellatus TaxID=120398 RepID=A0A485LS15_9STRA|nr:hypothetical protein As57867_024931 [Aphanomyces stellatus]VFU01640.1 Aste57867_25009 [Aphanomyces stellatus]
MAFIRSSKLSFYLFSMTLNTKHQSPQRWFERTFTALSSISSLVLHVGAVYVSPASASSQATIRVRSNSPSLLDAISVSEHRREWTLSWALDATTHLHGSYVVEIHVPPSSIESISFAAAGVAAVRPSVLATTAAHVALVSLGPGHLLVQEDDAIEANAITLRQMGSGVLQLTASTGLTADVVDVINRHTGVVAIVASAIHASQMSVSNACSGVVCLQATSTFALEDMQLVNRGSGAVRVLADACSIDHLDSCVFGTGSIHVSARRELIARSIESAVRGAGNIEVTCAANAGTATVHHMKLHGNGDVVTNVLASTSSVVEAGAGHVRTTAAVATARKKPCTTLAGTYAETLVPLVPTPQSICKAGRSETWAFDHVHRL